MAVVVVITGFAMGAVIVFFLCKKSRHILPIPENLNAFDNPLFFSNQQSHSDVVDTNKLVENAGDENSEPEASAELVLIG